MADLHVGALAVAARASSRRRQDAGVSVRMMPVAISAAEMPTRDGVSRVPVTLIRPDLGLISRS